MISAIKNNSYVTLKKNPYYKGERKPIYDTVTVRFNPDANSQLQQLGNKEISLMDPQVTTDLVQAGEKLSNVEIHKGFESTFEHMDLVQNNHGPFDPSSYGGNAQKALLVRQAFLHGLPRQEIIDKLIKPIVPDAEVRNSFLRVPGTPGYDEIDGGQRLERLRQDRPGHVAEPAQAGRCQDPGQRAADVRQDQPASCSRVPDREAGAGQGRLQPDRQRQRRLELEAR